MRLHFQRRAPIIPRLRQKPQRMINPTAILAFWYAEEMRSKWFASTPQLDALIKEKFETTWEAALRGDLDAWLNNPDGCLALAIVLDQFPLNMFRGSAKSFSSEHKAIAVAKHALGLGYEKLIERAKVAFLYLPLMHSENLPDQDLCVQLFAAAGLENNLRFAQHHREIVRRFGRFPHRNAILGRPSSAEELHYLNSKEAFLG
jgi:uncharacterized protein (DUF924 family)